MGFSVQEGDFADSPDLLAQLNIFFAANGWQTKLTISGASNGSFALFSDGTGQLDTLNISPGNERIYGGFIMEPVGADDIFHIQARYIDDFHGAGTITDWGTGGVGGFKDAFTHGGISTRFLYDDSGAGTYIVNTDGSATEGGTWYSLLVSTPGGSPDRSMTHGGIWSIPYRRVTLLVTGYSAGIPSITLASPPPPHWDPAKIGITKLLEFSENSVSVPSTGTVEQVSVASIAGNDLILTGPLLTTTPDLGVSVIGDWVHPIMHVDPTIVTSASNLALGKKMGGIAGSLSGPLRVTEPLGGVEDSGDPNSERNAFELAPVSMLENSPGITIATMQPDSVLQAADASGSTLGDGDVFQVLGPGGTTRRYKIKDGFPAGADLTKWAIRIQ